MVKTLCCFEFLLGGPCAHFSCLLHLILFTAMPFLHVLLQPHTSAPFPSLPTVAGQWVEVTAVDGVLTENFLERSPWEISLRFIDVWLDIETLSEPLESLGSLK